MDFFEYACEAAYNFCKECKYPGIEIAGKIPGGYVFVADLGPRWDDAVFFPDSDLFIFEEDKKIKQFPVCSHKHNSFLEMMDPIIIPDKYISPRILAKRAVERPAENGASFNQ